MSIAPGTLASYDLEDPMYDDIYHIYFVLTSQYFGQNYLCDNLDYDLVECTFHLYKDGEFRPDWIILQ